MWYRQSRALSLAPHDWRSVDQAPLGNVRSREGKRSYFGEIGAFGETRGAASGSTADWRGSMTSRSRRLLNVRAREGEVRLSRFAFLLRRRADEDSAQETADRLTKSLIAASTSSRLCPMFAARLQRNRVKSRHEMSRSLPIVPCSYSRTTPVRLKRTSVHAASGNVVTSKTIRLLSHQEGASRCCDRRGNAT